MINKNIFFIIWRLSINSGHPLDIVLSQRIEKENNLCIAKHFQNGVGITFITLLKFLEAHREKIQYICLSFMIMLDDWEIMGSK